MFPVLSFKVLRQNVTGAWCEDAFAIRVRTEKYVNLLKEFNEALRADKVLFAGLFFKRPGVRLSGVLLARIDYLTAEDLVAVKEAQASYELNLRLKAKDESRAILQQMESLLDQHWIGFLSAFRFSDETESEVRYWFNPGNVVNAGLSGTYSKEELLNWAQAKGSYRLSAS